MMRAFKTRYFQRWMSATGLTDAALHKAVQEMAAGLIDADLGGGVVKKRVALPGRGKRGGARTIVATNQAGRWFFMFGYAKNEQDSISAKELEAAQVVASGFIKRTDAQLDQAVTDGVLLEIAHVNQDPSPKPHA
jgi:hypothetical protein